MIREIIAQIRIVSVRYFYYLVRYVVPHYHSTSNDDLNMNPIVPYPSSTVLVLEQSLKICMLYLFDTILDRTHGYTCVQE